MNSIPSERKLSTALSSPKGETDNDGQTILQEIKNALACLRCGWQANEGRMEPTNIERIREYVGDWIIAAHIHWMRHNFWNRFANKPNFLSRKEWEQKLQARKVFADLADYAIGPAFGGVAMDMPDSTSGDIMIGGVG